MGVPAHQQTIFAPATAIGKTGVTVVRVSGNGAIRSLLSMNGGKRPSARRATIYTLKNDKGATIDRALVIAFVAPHSFTGEDCVEYHLHGGRAVFDALVSCLATKPDHRPAEPGEFTRRAFENGKLDLTEAEAIADLIHAETEIQRLQALEQLGGGLATLYHGWCERLTRSMAYLEAGIDFSEEDLPFEEIEAQTRPELEALSSEIEAHLSDSQRGERIREGIKIVIIGAPNAGKSSLLNMLAKRDVAIVTEQAGTTRDMIEVMLDLSGFPVVLVDTAGLREAQDRVEIEGIHRARKAASEADITLALFDGTQEILDPQTEKLLDGRAIKVLTKADLPDFTMREDFYAVSALTGEGVSGLLDAIQKQVADRYAPTAAASLTRERHRRALEEAHDHLERARAGHQMDLVAEDVRLALRAIGRITGRVDVEDLLDVIFRDFCIGK